MFQGINSYSIYGPGVTNDTIVPGYGITKFPVNLNTFWNLPNGTIRNFGEASQYVTYPVGRPNWMYQLAQNFMDPNHISQWNPMLIGVMDFTSNNVANPFMTQMGNVQAYQWGANMMQQMQISSAIQQIAGTLNSMESSLSNCLKSDKLTAAQKATLQELLEEVQKLKKEIEAKLKAGNPTIEEVTEMQKQVLDLQKKIGEEVDKIKAELSETENSDSNGETPGSDDTSSDDTGSASEPDLTGTEYEDIDPETGRSTKLGAVPSNSECREFCAQIFDAVDGCGTKNDVIETVVPAMTADNIVEIISYWDKNYGTGEKGLIWRLIHDLGHGEKKKYVPMILNALQTRAEALGIEDDISSEITKINNELGDWNISEGIISRNLSSIYDKIKAKEKENKTGAQEALDKKKTENNDKVSDKKKQIETEKKNELANKMKEQLKLSEVPQLSSKLKVETDDNGNFTGYSIKLDTPNGEVEVKGSTYQTLAVEIEKNNLKPEDVLIRKTTA